MRLFDLVNKYCKESNWKTLLLLKVCLLSIGIIIGILLPDDFKLGAIILFGIIFLITYIPLIIKFYKLSKKE